MTQVPPKSVTLGAHSWPGNAQAGSAARALGSNDQWARSADSKVWMGPNRPAVAKA